MPPALESVPDILKPPKGLAPTTAPVHLRLMYRLPTWNSRLARSIFSGLVVSGVVIEGHNGPLFADFHALRHSYITALGGSGVDLRSAQELAGHSTPALTSRYMHVRLHDLAGSVGKLPSFLPPDCATTPEQTMLELQKKLPRRYWIEINALLVPFGKHIGKGVRPHCSTCPVLQMCRQIGVTEHR